MDQSVQRRDLVVAPLCEAALVLAAGVLGWLSHQPLVFASLGPTAYEQIEKPHSRSSRPYNVLVGHLLGVLCGFVALALLHAFGAPGVTFVKAVPGPRMWAATLAAGLTVLTTLLARAQQPAALSTALLVAVGNMQTLRGAIDILVAVAVIAVLGEPLRRIRARAG